MRQYIGYALGETLLIMVGVLLAMQVSNWNENNKNRKIEQSYLIALQAEFLDNQTHLKRLIEKNSKCIESEEELAHLLDLPSNEISTESVSKLFNEIFRYSIQFNPNTGVFHDITNSGNLNKISDLPLRRLLASWETDYARIKIQENLVQETRDMMKDLLMEEGNFDKIQHSDSKRIVGLMLNAQSDPQKQNVWEKPSFKNNLLFLIVTSYALNHQYYQSFYEQLEETLNRIETNLNQE